MSTEATEGGLTMFFATDKLTVEYRPTITSITLNHEDWQLYDNAPGVDSMAAELNKTLRECVHEGCNAYQTKRVMLDKMRSSLFSAAGATDTEPMEVLDDLLEKIYGVNS